MSHFLCPFCRTISDPGPLDRWCSSCGVYVDDVLGSSPRVRKAVALIYSGIARHAAGTDEAAQAERTALVWLEGPMQSDTEAARLEKLSDYERGIMVGLLLDRLARVGCRADPAYIGLLRRLSGVDTVLWVERGGSDEIAD